MVDEIEKMRRARDSVMNSLNGITKYAEEAKSASREIDELTRKLSKTTVKTGEPPRSTPSSSAVNMDDFFQKVWSAKDSDKNKVFEMITPSMAQAFLDWAAKNKSQSRLYGYITSMAKRRL